MSDSINPNQRARSSRMNNATLSESPNSIPTTVNFYGTTNFNNTGPVNFGSGAIGFEKIVNGYYGNNQILNKLENVDATGNTRQRSVVQISDSTFVDLGINYSTQYIDFDNNLTPSNSVDIVFPSNIVVYYDTIRFHFLSGYNFPDIDGNIFQVRIKENSGKATKL